jgi:hypothetical protein
VVLGVQMTRVNLEPYPSTLGTFDINTFVTGDLADYEKIHPEGMTASVRVAIGTTIVREVLGASGSVAKLTVMRKGPGGYDPTLGDWWFGVTDPRGHPLDGDDGAPQLGRLDACHSCHLDRGSSNDFLFGVPATDMHAL